MTNPCTCWWTARACACAGAGERLLEKHGTNTRRSWRKLHIGVNAGSGQIVAASLTAKEVDDGAEVGPLLDQVTGAVSSFTADGGYNQDRVYDGVAQRHPEAAVIVPPRATAVPSDTAATAPTQRDRHLEHHRQTRTYSGLAEGVRLHHPGPSRSGDRPVQAGDRRRAALTHGQASSDRGARRGPCAQSHGGAWTPELRPHRLTSNGDGANAPSFRVYATCWG